MKPEFVGYLNTTEKVTPQISFPVEWSTRIFYSDKMPIISVLYHPEMDVKKTALIIEQEFKATNSEWILLGKWAKRRYAKDIISSCDCIGLESYLCDHCLSAFPPVDSDGKRVMCLPGTSCYVNGVKCSISKGRYGEGVEIYRHVDRVDAYRKKVEKLEKQHAREKADESKDFIRVKEWHVKYAARRLKETEDLEDEFKDVTCDLK